MKTYSANSNRKVRTRFTTATRFDVALATAAPFRGALEADLEQLKARLVRDLIAEAPDHRLEDSLRRAADEAASIAWTTSVPLLVLPELVREKAEAARRYTWRQAALLRRGRRENGRAA